MVLRFRSISVYSIKIKNDNSTLTQVFHLTCVRYEGVSTAELMDMLAQIDTTRDQQLAALKRNYEMDSAILEELAKKK